MSRAPSTAPSLAAIQYAIDDLEGVLTGKPLEALNDGLTLPDGYHGEVRAELARMFARALVAEAADVLREAAK